MNVVQPVFEAYATVVLPEISAKLTMAEVYEGVELPPKTKPQVSKLKPPASPPDSAPQPSRLVAPWLPVSK